MCESDYCAGIASTEHEILDPESSYLDSSAGSRFDVMWKLESIHLMEPKVYFAARETKQKGSEHPADVVEELAVDISRRRPARTLFNRLRWPSVERVSIVMHRPGFGGLEKRPVSCQPLPTPVFPFPEENA